jgi:hypothetical protein
MSDIPAWTGTPAPTPGPSPTPTTGPAATPTFTAPTDTTSYNIATPTSNDKLTAATTNGSFVKQLAKDGVSFFVTKFAGAAASALATKAFDRAVPTQGVDGTALLSPRDAQHIPTDWPKGLYGHPYPDFKPPYFTRVDGSDIPEGSAFTGIELARDTWSYRSPYTQNNLVDPKGLREVGSWLRKYQRETVGGIIPLYAWKVVEREVNWISGKVPYKFGTWFFFKEVYDDWMASHGYDRYQVDLDGPPTPGWPGVLRAGDPWAEDKEKIPGMKNWATANKAIAHFEFGEDIGEPRPLTLRYPKYRVDGGTTKAIEYPGNDITGRDEFPVSYPKLVTATSFPNDGTVVKVEQEAYFPEPPTRAEYDTAMAQTDIPVLPSAPPQPDEDDTEMTPPPEDEQDYMIVFRGIDMNVGDGEFVDANGRTGMDPGGKSAYSVDQAAELFEPYENMYGFVFGNSMAYVNNMKPSVMNWDKVYNYNDQYDYYSKMVEVSDTPTKRVGYIYSTWRASDLYPAHYRGQIVTSTDALELVDQPRLRAFDFGKAVTPYTRQEFVDFLTKETWNGKNNNDGYYCLAFEVDEADGQGYTNGFM